MVGCVAVLWPADEHEALIAEAAGHAGVDAALVRAIVWHESGFDAGKLVDGGYGLMQLGAGTGIEWAAAHGLEAFMVADLFDARTNLQAGTWYLAAALERWGNTDDPAAFALAEWSAGPDAVRAWAGESRHSADLRRAMQGTPTAKFVAKVLARARVK